MTHDLSLIERVYRRATTYLPPRLAGQLDLMRPDYRRGWGGPMNGQERRQALIREIFAKVRFDEVVETGTFRGGTTGWLHEISGLPVHSVESEERFYVFARQMLATMPKVDVKLGDSRALLRALADRPDDRRTFFYLDAHWGEDVPRHEELRIIQPRWRECVVVVDDFQVPGDAGYGYARYGGKPLDETYLPELPGWTLFYPAIPAAEETGSKRGCAIFAPPAVAPVLEQIPMLRKARHWQG